MKIEIVAVRRAPDRAVYGPFSTTGFCSPYSPMVNPTEAGCACTVGSGSARPRETQLAKDATLAIRAPVSSDEPLRRVEAYTAGTAIWLGGEIELSAGGMRIYVTPTCIGTVPPGRYDVELAATGGDQDLRIRLPGFAVLPGLETPNRYNHLDGISLRGFKYWTNFPDFAFPTEVDLLGKVYFPAENGVPKAGPIVIVGHGAVGCLDSDAEEARRKAVDGMEHILELLAANGFIAVGVEGTADAYMALATLGFLRNVDVPLGVELDLSGIPPECGFIGHSRAGSVFPAALNFINQQTEPNAAPDLYLNFGFLGGQPLAYALTLISYAAPFGTFLPDPLHANFPFLMSLSGDHDGDSEGGEGVKTFDAISGLAPKEYPWIQANVWARGLSHAHFLAPESAFTCDKDVIGPAKLDETTGKDLIRTCCAMWLLATLQNSTTHLQFFETRNLVDTPPSSALLHASEILWRAPFLPRRFFDRSNGAVDYSSNGVLDGVGFLDTLTALELSSFNMPHIATDGLIVEWKADQPNPTVEFPFQPPPEHADWDAGHPALVLQITAAVPPDGIPTGELELTFRVGVRSGDLEVLWVDLIDYGGWRPPTPVDIVVGNSPKVTATTVVLSTVSIPLRAFSENWDTIKGIKAVIFDLGSRYASGRLFIGSVVVAGTLGETLS